MISGTYTIFSLISDTYTIFSLIYLFYLSFYFYFTTIYYVRILAVYFTLLSSWKIFLCLCCLLPYSCNTVLYYICVGITTASVVVDYNFKLSFLNRSRGISLLLNYFLELARLIVLRMAEEMRIVSLIRFWVSPRVSSWGQIIKAVIFSTAVIHAHFYWWSLAER